MKSLRVLAGRSSAPKGFAMHGAGKVGNLLGQYKPAVEKRLLLLFAGGMWLAVGTMLLTLSFIWLRPVFGKGACLLAGIGVTAALMISHFGFSKIVEKNKKRILSLEGRRCAFSFMSWKSYCLVAVMVALGITLRHSFLLKPYLSILYTGIGLALVLGGARYERAFFRESSEKNI